MLVLITGIVGDANVLCRNLTVPSGNNNVFRNRLLLEDSNPIDCKIGSDCLYGQCTNGKCGVPDLQCPTSVTGMILTCHLYTTTAL